MFVYTHVTLYNYNDLKHESNLKQGPELIDLWQLLEESLVWLFLWIYGQKWHLGHCIFTFELIVRRLDDRPRSSLLEDNQPSLKVEEEKLGF